VRNETKTWQIGDGLWSSSYGGELHAISADQTLRTRGHSTERTAACARFLRNEAKKHSCFQTDDTRWAPRKRTHAPSRAYNSARAEPRPTEGLERSRRARWKHGLTPPRSWRNKSVFARCWPKVESSWNRCKPI